MKKKILYDYNSSEDIIKRRIDSIIELSIKYKEGLSNIESGLSSLIDNK